MDPWEIATITILAVIVALAAGVGIKSMNTGSVSAIAGTFFFAVTNFIPFGLLTFGLIADLIGQEFRYTIGSLVGIFSIIGNYLLKFVLEPFMAIPPAVATTGDSGKAWCMIPGLEGLENRVTPMNFVSSTAIMTYYLIFAALNRNASQNISIGVMFPLILVLQMVTFYLGSCDQYYPAGWAGKLGAVVLGVIFGSTGYGIISSLYPASSPFGYGIKNPVNPSPSGWQGAREPPSSGIGGPQTGAKCSAANTDDDNAYVCEAYKNGVLVTEKIS